MSEQPKVAILMGSDSDYEKLIKAFETLREFEVPFSAHVISAHRTPARAHEFATTAEEKGYQVIICAAGLAAHLGGVIASSTILPVIGIPVEGGPLKGLDALLATVQMPPGIAVATVGISNGMNAALLAIQILARSDPDLAAKLHDYRAGMTAKVEAKDKKLQEKLQN